MNNATRILQSADSIQTQCLQGNPLTSGLGTRFGMGADISGPSASTEAPSAPTL